MNEEKMKKELGRMERYLGPTEFKERYPYLFEVLGTLDTKSKQSVDLHTKQIKKICMNGLTTDGAHHKQWYFERILVAMGYTLEEINRELYLEQAKAENYWEKGIPP